MPGQATCPLCAEQAVTFFYSDQKRDYHQCQHCQLVFVPDCYLLDHAAEKAQYDLHCNHPDDSGYRAFLGRLLLPLQACLHPQATGLDFGCGPGPVLAGLLSQQGFQMALFDPYYYPDEGVLQATYDFVTCTEVIEHVCDARQTWNRLSGLLNPGGWLGIMTKRVMSHEAFTKWHYKNDPTHVRFYSEDTFRWAARHWGMSLTFPASDVVLLQKTPLGNLP